MKKTYIVTINTIDHYGYAGTATEYVTTDRIDAYIAHRTAEIKSKDKWDWYYAKYTDGNPIITAKEITVVNY